MKKRCRILLPALATASLCLFATTQRASAFELLDQLLNLGGGGYGSNCGCDPVVCGTPKGGHMQKGGLGHAQKGGCGHAQKGGRGLSQKGGCGHVQKGGCGLAQKGGCGHVQKGHVQKAGLGLAQKGGCGHVQKGGVSQKGFFGGHAQKGGKGGKGATTYLSLPRLPSLFSFGHSNCCPTSCACAGKGSIFEKDGTIEKDGEDYKYEAPVPAAPLRQPHGIPNPPDPDPGV